MGPQLCREKERRNGVVDLLEVVFSLDVVCPRRVCARKARQGKAWHAMAKHSLVRQR